MEIELKAKLIEEYLDEILPNAGCELNYTTDYSFLIAVMLSAQTTDKKVNNVTKILFDKYKSLDELANAKYEDIYNIVKPLGLAKNKANNVIQIASILIEKYTFIDCSLTLLGFIYVGVLFSFIYLVSEKTGGNFYVWLIFIGSWMTDTAAYYAGRFLGKHKLCPRVSPKKTVEGSIGGLLGATVFCGILGIVTTHYIN